MITTATVLTLSLAKALGVYFIAAGASGLIARERWGGIIESFQQSPALTYISGVFVFALGVAIILAHNIWTDPLASFISFIGWAAAIEGLVLVAVPDPLLKWAASIMRSSFITAFAAFTIVLGVILLVLGLTGRVGIA